MKKPKARSTLLAFGDRLNGRSQRRGAVRMAAVAGHLDGVAGGFAIRAAIVAVAARGAATAGVITHVTFVCHGALLE